MGYNLLINGVYWGYNPFTNHLLTSWDIQVFILSSYLWNSHGTGRYIYRPQTLNGTGIFTYVWLISMVNVGKYTVYHTLSIWVQYMWFILVVMIMYTQDIQTPPEVWSVFGPQKTYLKHLLRRYLDVRSPEG